MTETPPLLQMILENIQSDLADLRDQVHGLKGELNVVADRLDTFREAMDARWDANDARWRENQAEHREFREALAIMTERLHREQTLRERNARRTIAVLDALVGKVNGIDTRVTALEE